MPNKITNKILNYEKLIYLYFLLEINNIDCVMALNFKLYLKKEKP